VTAKLTIELMDGQRIERLATLEKGKAQKWISEGELEKKFRACAERVLPADRASKTFDMLLRLEGVENIKPLTELVRMSV
jgi:hypothetical protein